MACEVLAPVESVTPPVEPTPQVTKVAAVAPVQTGFTIHNEL